MGGRRVGWRLCLYVWMDREHGSYLRGGCYPGGADVSCLYHIMKNEMEGRLAVGTIKSERFRTLI